MSEEGAQTARRKTKSAAESDDIQAMLAEQRNEITRLKAQVAESNRTIVRTPDQAATILSEAQAMDERIVIELLERRDASEPEIVKGSVNTVPYEIHRMKPVAVTPGTLSTLKDAVTQEYRMVSGSDGNPEVKSWHSIRFPYMVLGPVSQYVKTCQSTGREVPLSVIQSLKQAEREKLGLKLPS